jgi:hypothetical protein
MARSICIRTVKDDVENIEKSNFEQSIPKSGDYLQCVGYKAIYQSKINLFTVQDAERT